MVPSIILIVWPLISVGLFAACGGKRGLILSVIIGYLFLPDSFEIVLPLVGYNKAAAIAVGLVLSYVFFSKRWRAEIDPLTPTAHVLRWLIIGLLVAFFLSPFLVYLTNREALSFGPTWLPAVGPRDAVAQLLDAGITLVPFFFGLWILAKSDDLRLLLRTLVIATLFYSLLALFEIRMSPQLNVWIYGYFPHEWLQHVRGDGYRPLVFLPHGLVLGFLLLWGVLASAALSRESTPTGRLAYLAASLWLLGVLLVTRNLGSGILAILFLPIVVFLGPALQIRISAVIATIFLLYPAVRQADVLPVDRFVSVIQTFAPERAKSFEFRLHHEQLLLERAGQKPISGWGGYGRYRLFDERGKDISVADGIWIIVMGKQGWLGYISFFGLIALPLIWLGRVRKRKTVPLVVTGAAIMMGVNLIDMIPNSTLSPIALMLAGALAGFAIFDPANRTEHAEAQVPVRREQRFTRFGRSSP